MKAKAKGTDDWEGKTVSQLRALIEKADPEAVEGVKVEEAHQPERSS